MTRRTLLWRSVAVFTLIVTLVAGRGFILATLASGSYPLSAFCFDTAALMLLLAWLHAVDAAFTAGMQWIAKTIPPSWQAVVIQSARLPFVLLVLFPFMIVAINVHPQRIRCLETPASLGMQFEKVALTSDGISLSAWYVPGEMTPGPAIVIAHGLGANKQNFLTPVASLHERGYSVLIFDFRAHGDSGGQLSTYGLLESRDVKSAYDWLANRHPGQPIYALGYSMGGAAVARAVFEYDIFDKVVLDSTFSSLRSIAHHRFLRFFGPFESLVWGEGRFWARLWTRSDFGDNDTTRCASALRKRPLLLIHGQQDRLIPFTESVLIHDAVGAHAQLWLVPDAGHVETTFAPDYALKLDSFFREGVRDSGGSLESRNCRPYSAATPKLQP